MYMLTVLLVSPRSVLENLNYIISSTQRNAIPELYLVRSLQPLYKDIITRVVIANDSVSSAQMVFNALSITHRIA